MSSRTELLELLVGEEIWSPSFETLVTVREDGSITTFGGEVVCQRPSVRQLRELFSELFQSEFGTMSLEEIL